MKGIVGHAVIATPRSDCEFSGRQGGGPPMKGIVGRKLLATTVSDRELPAAEAVTPK
jgi:hypothetical protein